MVFDTMKNESNKMEDIFLNLWMLLPREVSLNQHRNGHIFLFQVWKMFSQMSHTQQTITNKFPNKRFIFSFQGHNKICIFFKKIIAFSQNQWSLKFIKYIQDSIFFKVKKAIIIVTKNIFSKYNIQTSKVSCMIYTFCLMSIFKM